MRIGVLAPLALGDGLPVVTEYVLVRPNFHDCYCYLKSEIKIKVNEDKVVPTHKVNLEKEIIKANPVKLGARFLGYGI